MLCWGPDMLGTRTMPYPFIRWRAVAMSSVFGCGITEEYDLKCWGAGGFETPFPSAGKYTDVVASVEGACAMEIGGTVVCFGNSTFSNADLVLPKQLSYFTDLSITETYGCAVHVQGQIRCWGSDLVPTLFAPSTVQPASAVSFQKSCACLVDAIGGIYCWGSRTLCEPPNGIPSSGWASIKVSLTHICGLMLNGTLVCWSENIFGECDVPGGSNTSWKAVAIGLYITCGVTTEGAVLCWGQPNDVKSTIPMFSASQSVVELSIGAYDACAIMLNGGIVCWGASTFQPPTLIENEVWTKVDCFREACCGVTSRHRALCWGKVPEDVIPNSGQDFSGWTLMKLSAAGTCGLTVHGEIVCRVLHGEKEKAFLTSVPPAFHPKLNQFQRNLMTPDVSLLGSFLAVGNEFLCYLPLQIAEYWTCAGSHRPVEKIIPADGAIIYQCFPTNSSVYPLCCLIEPKGSPQFLRCYGYEGASVEFEASIFSGAKEESLQPLGSSLCGISRRGTGIHCFNLEASNPTSYDFGALPLAELFSTGTCIVGLTNTKKLWVLGDCPASDELPDHSITLIGASDRMWCYQVENSSNVTCIHWKTGEAAYWEPWAIAGVRTSLQSLVVAGDTVVALDGEGFLWCQGPTCSPQMFSADQRSFTSTWQGLIASPSTWCVRSTRNLYCHGLALNHMLIAEAVERPVVHVRPKTQSPSTQCEYLEQKKCPSVESIACGAESVCKLSKGGIVCTGATNPQFRETIMSIPTLPEGVEWTAIALGFDHACGITSDGQLLCWGSNFYFQTSVPKLPEGVRWRDVSAGPYHTCAQSVDGVGTRTNYCFGYTDVRIAIDSGIQYEQFSAGYFHGCGITTDSECICWGHNGDNQASPPKLGPVWSSVSAGAFHTCGITIDGQCHCWGAPNEDRLAVPELASNLTWVQVSSNYQHSCGLISNGNIVCWGLGVSGSLRPPGIDGSWKGVATGWHHTCGIPEESGVRCWGEVSFEWDTCHTNRIYECPSLSTALSELPSGKSFHLSPFSELGNTRFSAVANGLVKGGLTMKPEKVVVTCEEVSQPCLEAVNLQTAQHWEGLEIIPAPGTDKRSASLVRIVSTYSVVLTEVKLSAFQMLDNVPLMLIQDVPSLSLSTCTFTNISGHLHTSEVERMEVRWSLFDGLQSDHGALRITDVAHLLFDATTVTNCAVHKEHGVVNVASPSGAGIVTLIFHSVNFIKNVNDGPGSGGALYVEETSSEEWKWIWLLNEVQFIDNTALSGDGGGFLWRSTYKFVTPQGDIHGQQPILLLVRVNCTGNTAFASGGCGKVEKVNVKAWNLTVVRNAALEGEGGGFAFDHAALIAEGLDVQENTAATSGGGISASLCPSSGMKVKSSSFLKNEVRSRGLGSKQSGGALRATSCSVTLESIELGSNSAVHGGGLYLDAMSTLNASNIVASFNRAMGGTGGFVSAHSLAIGLFSGLNVTGNAAEKGGGLYFSNCPLISVVETSLLNNTAHTIGGAVLADTSSLAASHLICRFNLVTGRLSLQPTEDGGGGCLFLKGGNFLLENSLLEKNMAPRGGGIALLFPAELGGGQFTLSNNEAWQAGSNVFLDNTPIESLPRNMTIAHSEGPGKAASFSTTAFALEVEVWHHEIIDGVTLENTPVARLHILDQLNQAVGYDSSTSCSLIVFGTNGLAASALTTARYTAVDGIVNIAPFGISTTASRVTCQVTCTNSLSTSFELSVLLHPQTRYVPPSRPSTVLPGDAQRLFYINPPPTLVINSNVSNLDSQGSCWLQPTQGTPHNVQLFGLTTKSLRVTSTTPFVGVVEFHNVSLSASTSGFPVNLEAWCQFGVGRSYSPETSYEVYVEGIEAVWAKPWPRYLIPSSPLQAIPISPVPTVELRVARSQEVLTVLTSCTLTASSAEVSLYGSIRSSSTSNAIQFFPTSIFLATTTSLPTSSSLNFTITAVCSWFQSFSVVVESNNITIPAVQIHSTLDAERATQPYFTVLQGAPLGISLDGLIPSLTPSTDPQFEDSHVLCDLQARAVGTTVNASVSYNGPLSLRDQHVAIPTSTIIDIPPTEFPVSVTLGLECTLRQYYVVAATIAELVVHPVYLQWVAPPPAAVFPSSKTSYESLNLKVALSSQASMEYSSQLEQETGRCDIKIISDNERNSEEASLVGAMSVTLTHGAAEFTTLGLSAPYGSSNAMEITCWRRWSSQPLTLRFAVAIPSLLVRSTVPPPSLLQPQSPVSMTLQLVYGGIGILALPNITDGAVHCSVKSLSPGSAVVNDKGAHSGSTITWSEMKVVGRMLHQYSIAIECSMNGHNMEVDPSTFQVTIAGCPAGSQPDELELACLECPESAYSDGNLMKCRLCPAVGAKCELGELQLLPGHFPSDPMYLSEGVIVSPSLSLYRCPNPEACQVSSNRTFSCSEGYTGVLCAACQENLQFTSTSEASCSRCWPQGLNVLITILGVVAAIALLVYVALFKQHKKSTAGAILLRLLLNYLQYLNALEG